MTDEQALKQKSNAIQAALDKPPKDHPNGHRSAFCDPDNTTWWLSYDIRPDAIHLTINSLTLADAVALTRYLRTRFADQPNQEEQSHA